MSPLDIQVLAAEYTHDSQMQLGIHFAIMIMQ